MPPAESILRANALKTDPEPCAMSANGGTVITPMSGPMVYLGWNRGNNLPSLAACLGREDFVLAGK
jgi:hypothetical protein